ncbi:DNA endonuclease SmrA [Shewanella aestuarii]|uniref:DNA endonuclease SmrA n=1 Tax=Shewanella aestuarii TaxID=1028752 RepID=A0A6G9QKX8_9GAMM|nr:DNA endonuclease SmrA [Shewanella aestuarii]QIR14519.1 DNA endonuclease SmrA [Shewanella aestuarii]
MHLNETELFFQEMADVTPLKTDSRTQREHYSIEYKPTAGQVAKQAALNEHELLQILSIEPHVFNQKAPDEIVFHRHDGMQEAVFKHLRLGKYDIKTILDVHQYSLYQARHSIINCILGAYERGERNILIIHGKGFHSKPYAGLMKSAVCDWLTRIEQVAAFHSATPEQGGSGALFVMLKKSQQKRIENSELNRKGHGFR